MTSAVVTGFGRSGTLFLKTILSQSKLWTVSHEPGGKRGAAVIDNVLRRLELPAYIEVNSYLRIYWTDLPNPKYLIHRNPVDIALSICNRKGDPVPAIKDLGNWYEVYQEYKGQANEVIDFNKMTTDKEYLESIAVRMGVTDIDFSKVSMDKVNTNKTIKYRRFEDLPQNLADLINSMGW